MSDIFGNKVSQGKGFRKVTLTEEALSADLEYFYKKATAEILNFHDKKYIDKVGVMRDGILYCKTRMLES